MKNEKFLTPRFGLSSVMCYRNFPIFKWMRTKARSFMT